MTGRFISFEGIDGAGKSTHIEAVAQRLRDAGACVVCTREPGGTALAERLREVILHATMDGLTEALLVFAARQGRQDHRLKMIAARREDQQRLGERVHRGVQDHLAQPLSQ